MSKLAVCCRLTLHLVPTGRWWNIFSHLFTVSCQSGRVGGHFSQFLRRKKHVFTGLDTIFSRELSSNSKIKILKFHIRMWTVFLGPSRAAIRGPEKDSFPVDVSLSRTLHLQVIYRPAESIHQCQVTAESLSSGCVGSVSSWCPEGTGGLSTNMSGLQLESLLFSLTINRVSVCSYNIQQKYDTDPLTEIKDFLCQI